MIETITQLGTLLLAAAALLAALWTGYRLIVQRKLDKTRQSGEEARRGLTALESSLRNLQSKVAAIEAMVDRESTEKRVQASVEAETLKIVEAAERENAAAVGSIQPDFGGYTTDMGVTLEANGVAVDGWTDLALLRSLIDQFGLRGSN
jgi:hypothetical protein